MNCKKPGFTLVELMIVMGIIAVLIALLLPAIQSAREAVRRSHCANDMTQLGIALANYAATHSVLPPGVVNDKGPIQNLPTGYHHSWVVQILPFMQHTNTYNHLNITASAYDIANDTAATIRISTLHCPSNPSSGPISFAGCHHDGDAAIDSSNTGVLYLNSHVRFDQIVDGTTQTILLGEVAEPATLGWVSGTRSTLRNTGMPMNEKNTMARQKAVAGTFATPNPRDVIFETIEQLAESGIWPVDGSGGFSSYHGTTCNFLFCDGSVRSLKQSIDPRIYRLLGNRADREPISADAY